ncbi:MAG: hypothetical protein EAS52_25975 [Parapedobacter sp.]|nr:MAG: hypothetical protein EAS52_25975 [Parapedobacter sp.]
MIIISINHEYEPYFNGSYPIDDDSTGRKKQVYLVLYRDIIRTGFNETVVKKPVAKFFGEDEAEIPPRKWTPEMKALVQQQIQENPVQRYRKITTLGKLVFSVAGLLVMVGIAAFVYAVFVSAPKQEGNRAAFTQLPEVGDRYYGSLFGRDYMAGGKLRAGWAIVESVNPQDSTITLCLSEDIGDFTFETMRADHSNFEGPTFHTKFSSGGRKNRFKGVDTDFEFESATYQDNFDAYKIPANHE